MKTIKYSSEPNWSSREILGLCFIIFAAIFFRFLNLGDKPFHHDEAIFGMYAFYQFNDPLNAFYHYIPMLNGPLLFHLYLPWFLLFGSSDFSIRALPALLGSAMVFIPYFLKDKLDKKLVFIATIAIGFSPLFMYYSRFVRHEYLVIWVYIAFLYELFFDESRRKYFFLALLLWIHWCIKENFFVFLAILLGYEIFQHLLQYLKNKTFTFTSGVRIPLFPRLKNEWQSWGIGFLTGLLLFMMFYSFYGRYLDGFLDGLYRAGFSYWMNQHQMERIKGPFSFHFFMLSWYELANALLILFVIIRQILNYYSKRQLQIFIVSIFSIAIFCMIWASSLLSNDFFYNTLKFKIPLDFFIFFISLFLALYHCTILWWQNQFKLSFLFYLGIANFFSYSYLGEKVPWLALYPLFFFLIMAIYSLQQEIKILLQWKKSILISISLLFLAYNVFYAINTSIFRAANLNELIIQVHPVAEFKDAMKEIIYVAHKKNITSNTKILILNDPTWICTWYFHNDTFQIAYDANLTPLENHDIIITTVPDMPILATHNKEVVPYSGWWVPDYSLLTIANFFSYALFHEAWNESGLIKIYIYSRKGFYGT